MMNLERLTEKGRSALSSANELAKHDNHGQIEPAHLLAALLNQEGGVVQQVISKVGGSLAAAQRVIQEEIERMPRIYGGSEPSISPRLRQVLEAAWSEMGQFHDEYLSVEHLLLALFDAGDEATARVLRAAGLTHENVLQALTSIRGAQRVIQREVENRIARAILDGTIHEGGAVQIDVQNGTLVMVTERTQAPKEAQAH